MSMNPEERLGKRRQLTCSHGQSAGSPRSHEPVPNERILVSSYAAQPSNGLTHRETVHIESILLKQLRVPRILCSRAPGQGTGVSAVVVTTADFHKSVPEGSSTRSQRSPESFHGQAEVGPVFLAIVLLSRLPADGIVPAIAQSQRRFQWL